MKIKLTLSYRGTNYNGWQVQAGNPLLRTIQGELEQALFVLFRSEHKKRCQEEWCEKIAVMGSGRTDSGVHARGQVASFYWPMKLAFERDHLLSALNGILPDDISVREAEAVDDSFDARRSPHSKRYVYRMLLGEEKAGCDEGLLWCLRRYPLNLKEMVLAARMFRRQHDFSNFRTADCTAKTTIRTLLLSELVRVSDEEIAFIVEGCGFLKQMVRIMVRALVQVGKGKLKRDELEGYLRHPEIKVSLPPAPPQGLVLGWVRYESGSSA